MARPSNLKVTRDDLDAVRAEIEALADLEVLVGWPDETTDDREGVEDGQKAPITNAALAYIHDNGAPEVNIPARPFMKPAIEEAQDKITAQLVRVAKLAMAPKEQRRGATARGLMDAVGLAAQRAVVAKINEGVPPPLADYTLKQRAKRGRKGAQQELDQRAQGLPPGTDLAKPLVDTAAMRNACTYVIRSRSERPKE